MPDGNRQIEQNTKTINTQPTTTQQLTQSPCSPIAARTPLYQNHLPISQLPNRSKDIPNSLPYNHLHNLTVPHLQQGRHTLPGIQPLTNARTRHLQVPYPSPFLRLPKTPQDSSHPHHSPGVIHNTLSTNTLTYNRQSNSTRLSQHNPLIPNTLRTTPNLRIIAQSAPCESYIARTECFEPLAGVFASGAAIHITQPPLTPNGHLLQDHPNTHVAEE